MDNGAPTLEVGFAIEPDYAELERLQTVMNSTEAKVLASARQVEQATSGMVNLGAATAKFSTFGNAATQAGATAEAAFAKATKSGEAMSRQLQYQIDTFGMSKTAARAYFAELAGNTELAERLRTQEAELNALREKSVTGLHAVTGATGQARIGQMEMMHVVRGMSDQIAAGASPIQALSMHMSMLGQAASLSGSSMGKLGTFLSGGWGIAIMAGLAVLTPLVAKLFEGNDALDASVDKLKKDAAQTDLGRHAKDLFAHSEEGVAAAIRDRIAAQEEEINKSRTQGEQDNLLAQKALNVETATRKVTQALLEQAIAQENINRINSQRPGERGDLAAMQLTISNARVAGLQDLLDKNAAAMKQAGVEFQNSLVELAKEAAKRQTEPLEAIKRKYDDQVKALDKSVRATIAAGGVVDKSLTDQYAAIERNRQAAIKAEQDKQHALKETANQIGRNITLEEGRRIAESVGGRVTSDHRSLQEQQKLYDKYIAYKSGTGPWAALAAKPGSSMHELDQAVDVAKSDGVTLKKLIGAYRAAGVKLVEALDEGNHYHIAWAKVGDAAKQQTAEAAAAAREVREAARAAKAKVDDAQNFILHLNDETGKIGKTAIEIKQIEIAAAAAKAPTQALRDAIYEAGSAWELATKMHEFSSTPLEFKIPTLEEFVGKMGDPVGDYLQGIQDHLAAVAEQAQATGQVLQDAFGNAGGVFGSLLANMADYGAAQQYWANEVLKDSSKQGQAERALHSLRAKNTSDALSGLKSLFKEHSTGYKVMGAIEKAYAAFQAVETALSIAREFTKTATTVTQSGIRTAANTAEGGSKIFAELGPWAFPVVAAMVAVLAALGAKGHGGGAVAAPTSAEDLQAAAGTGTVLGSPKDKSASIANSLEMVAKNTNADLQYSNQMLIALRSIDLSIGAMAASVAKQINVAGSLFDTSGLKLGSSGSSGFLGLFSSSTTRTLYDSGIQLVATTVGNIISNGIAGSTYQIVEQVKKKSGFLGIGGGTKTSYVTSTGGLPGDITSAVQDVIVALRNGLVEAANVIGIDGASAMLDGFQVSIGKVSFKDMSGQEIEDQLNAIFSSIGDQMAGTLLPSLTSMQKVGEGLFETFTRVAKEYEAIDIEMQSIGRGFGAVGVGSIAARDALVQLFGGLDEFISATDAFRDKFLTDAERMAPIQAAVIAELQRLGLSSVTTRDQFKSVVLGLDLTTDAGRQMYASLLSVAPAFDKVASYFEDANKKLADTLQSTVDKFKGFVDSLTKYRATLFDTTESQAAAYATLRRRFTETAALAATGDPTALGGLQDSAKSFLDTAKDRASSWLDYQRDVAMVARGVDQGIFAAESTADYAQLQLDAMKNANGILQQISVNTAATAAALTQPIAQPVSAPAPTSPTEAPATQADIEGLTSAVSSGLTAVATNTDGMLRTLRTVTRNGYLAVGGDADTPVYTADAPTVIP